MTPVTETLNRSAVVWGVVFVALGLAGLLDALGVWTLQLGIVLPVLFILAGVALTAAAFLRR